MTMLASCAAAPPPLVVEEEETSPEIINYSSVEQWLNLQQHVAGLSTE